MASTFISRTFSGTYNKGTISMWLKRSGLGSQYIFYNESASDSNDYALIQFDSSDRIEFMTVTNGTHTQKLITNRVFRDTSAFYHFVFAMDTDNSTADNRLRIYVNGVEETSYNTRDNGSQGDTNYMFQTSATNKHRMFASSGGSACFDGLATHIHIVPNSQLAPTVFGETDSTSGIWKPKTAPSVTYTAQGAFLKFENSGNLDLDSSGNNLSFTTSGTLTQNVDTPSNNFCTWNRMNPFGGTLANGNLTVGNSSSYNHNVQGTLGMTSGKWYWEYKMGNSHGEFGVCEQAKSPQTDPQNAAGNYFIYNNGSNTTGTVYNNVSGSSSSTVTVTAFASNMICGCAYDADNEALYFHQNGTYVNSGDPTSGASKTGAIITSLKARYGGVIVPFMGFGTSSARTNFHANFGNGYFGTTAVASANADGNGIGAFEYAVPSGYYALCTKNIKEFG